jgi:hypothetical protein
MRLIFGETDCLHLAVPYAFMAVLAVRLFEFIIVVHWFPLRGSIAWIGGRIKRLRIDRRFRFVFPIGFSARDKRNPKQ